MPIPAPRPPDSRRARAATTPHTPPTVRLSTNRSINMPTIIQQSRSMAVNPSLSLHLALLRPSAVDRINGNTTRVRVRKCTHKCAHGPTPLTFSPRRLLLVQNGCFPLLAGTRAFDRSLHSNCFKAHVTTTTIRQCMSLRPATARAEAMVAFHSATRRITVLQYPGALAGESPTANRGPRFRRRAHAARRGFMQLHLSPINHEPSTTTQLHGHALRQRWQ